jgi:hypothetical protein
MSRLSPSWVVAFAVLSNACVVTTHGGTGTSPTVPLPAEETRAPAAAPVGPIQIGAAHFLISYRGAMRAAPYVERTKGEARELAAQLRERVLSGEDFSKIAAEFSDDRGSAADGGKLGLFRRDQMVPEFSNAAFAMEVGQLSQVIESPFGFHVILRTE